MPYSLKRVSILFFFGILSYASVAQHSNIITAINNAPKNELKSLDLVIAFIQNHATTDVEKAYGVYYWIARNIKYDIKNYEKNKGSYTIPNDIFEKKKAICQGYAILYQFMCTRLHIECKVIVGYSKGHDYTNGQAFTRSDHAWNALKLDNIWYLVDVTWASGNIKGHRFVAKYSADQFQVNPQVFVSKRLADIPMWQLLPNPVSLKTFSAGDKRINDHFKTLLAPPFNFSDSIRVFLAQDSILQTFDSGKQVIVFNPSNTAPLAFAMLNATTITISKDPKAVQQMSLHTLDSLITSTNTVNDLLKRAKNKNVAFTKVVALATNKTAITLGLLYYYKSITIKHQRDSLNQSSDSLIIYYQKYLSALENALTEIRKTNLTKFQKTLEPKLCYNYIQLYKTYTNVIAEETNPTIKNDIEKERTAFVNRTKKFITPSNKFYKPLNSQMQ
jgi:hypothetical protein